MQKDVGSVMALYPTPVTIVGLVKDGQVNLLNMAICSLASTRLIPFLMPALRSTVSFP